MSQGGEGKPWSSVLVERGRQRLWESLDSVTGKRRRENRKRQRDGEMEIIIVM